MHRLFSIGWEKWYKPMIWLKTFIAMLEWCVKCLMWKGLINVKAWSVGCWAPAVCRSVIIGPLTPGPKGVYWTHPEAFGMGPPSSPVQGMRVKDYTYKPCRCFVPIHFLRCTLQSISSLLRIGYFLQNRAFNPSGYKTRTLKENSVISMAANVFTCWIVKQSTTTTIIMLDKPVLLFREGGFPIEGPFQQRKIILNGHVYVYLSEHVQNVNK